MHPSLVRAYVTEHVDELRARLDGRNDLGVVSMDFDAASMELFIGFDHVTHKTEHAAISTNLVHASGQVMSIGHRVPLIGGAPNVRRLVLHVGLDGFDFDPPTAQLLTADREPLPAPEWPTSWAGGGIVNGHPVYDRPFFCREGLREFHTHPQHEDSPWHEHRDATTVHGLVTGLLEDLCARWQAAA